RGLRGLGRVVGLVLGDHLDAAAEHATVGVGLFDGDLDADGGLLTGVGRDTRQREDRADLERIGGVAPLAPVGPVALVPGLTGVRRGGGGRGGSPVVGAPVVVPTTGGEQQQRCQDRQ